MPVYEPGTRRVEGLLYGLRDRPDARPAAAPIRSIPRERQSPGIRDSFPESDARLDVAIAMRRLDESDRDVLWSRYVAHRRVPYRTYSPALRRLVALVGHLDTAGD